MNIKTGMEELGKLVAELDRQTNPKGSWEPKKATLSCTDRWGTCEADERCYCDDKYAPKCEACVDLDELEKEHPGETHEGAVLGCGECGAEYWEEYGGTRYHTNKQGALNHPELASI